MELKRQICARAMQSRDARFDGRFFTGVLTTGIYCRPVCPAPSPRLKNVKFFPSAAAAAESGLRPCLRCRPESSPGTPAWSGTSATVARAIRLIADGNLDGSNVESLAACLGVSSRHLGRLFRKHVGAAPVSVAQTRRIHLAKRLLDETDLPMSQVAKAAGFNSIRRFNAALKGCYDRTPSELRRQSARSSGRGASAELVLRLAFRPPFDWASVSEFLAARAIPGVEIVRASGYARTIRLDEHAGHLEVKPLSGTHQLELSIWFPNTSAICTIVDRTRRIFDLDAAPDPIARHLSGDPDLRPAVRRWPGLRVPGAWDGFEVAIRAILGQQVTVRGATTLTGRLVDRFGSTLDDAPSDGLSRLFPEACDLASTDVGCIGIPAGRARAIRLFAEAVADGRLALDGTMDFDAFVSAAVALPGIGDWTAQYVAMRALREPDAFPSTDLGLVRAAAGSGGRITPAALRHRAEKWRPWRAYAAMLLWKSPQEKTDDALHVH